MLLDKWREKLRMWRAARRGFDLWYGRWLVTLAVPVAGTLAILENRFASYAFMALALLLLLYFAHLLLRRLQVSIAEALTATFFLATVNGLFLTTPGVRNAPLPALPMTAVLLAWVLAGVARGLAHAELLAEGRRRIPFMLMAWATLASPAAVVLGVSILITREIREEFVGSLMLQWAYPLIVVGAAGMVFGAILETKARRAAALILVERDVAAPIEVMAN